MTKSLLLVAAAFAVTARGAVIARTPTAAAAVVTSAAQPVVSSAAPVVSGTDAVETYGTKALASLSSEAAAAQKSDDAVQLSYCKGDTTSTDGIQDIKAKSNYIGYLDTFLDVQWEHEKNWVVNLWNQEFPDNGASPLTGCGNIDGTCSFDTPCKDYQDTQAYWILLAVQRLHSKLSIARSTLTYNGWIDSLSIDQIGKDFSPPAPDNNWMSIAASAFGMAGSVIPEAGDMINLVSNALWLTSSVQSDGNVVDTTSMETTLRNTAKAIGDALTQTLQDATGNGDPSKLSGVSDDYTYATTRFYEQSGILVDENKDNSTFTQHFSDFISTLDKKLVNMGMYSAYYVLLMDSSISSQDDCKDDGQLWLPYGSKSGCFYLTTVGTATDCDVADPTQCRDDEWQPPGYGSANNFNKDVYGKLTDTYHIDLNTFYTAIIDCNMNGDGNVDNDNKVNDIPRCFYNLNSMSGYFSPNDEGSSSWMTINGFKTLKST